MIKKIYPFLLLIFVSKIYCIATELPDKTTFLQSDRFCYVSGDLVLLKIVHLNANKDEVFDESVIYADIVDADSQFIAGEIFKLDQGIASGYIRIPDTVKTGNFLIRVYTYKSRNSGGQVILESRQIYITNRFGNNSVRYDNRVEVLKIDQIILQEKSNANCKVDINDSLFTRRSKVTATIQLSNQTFDDTLWATFSVKPVSLCESTISQLNEVELTTNQLKPILELQNSDIAESKGMIVSGRIFHNITGNSLSNMLVLLAIEDSVIRLKYSITDSNGSFKFLLTDCYEKQTIYLSTYSYPSFTIYPQANIVLDSKFLDKRSTQLSPKIGVGYETSIDSLNVLKSILAKAYDISYNSDLPYKNKIITPYEHLFIAGNITNTVLIDEYIDLPDFIQITREILPFVRLRKDNNKYVFSVIDGENSVIRENPIVFVDGVPLNDINAILSWGSDKIRLVQVQSGPRYFGDVAFEKGMIFIWTKKMDFWKKTEDKYAQIFTIPCFQKPITFNFPDYSKQNSNTLPDFRQILFWEPSLIIKDSKSMQLSFYTSDEVGYFEVLFEGVTSSKSQVFIRKYIQVK